MANHARNNRDVNDKRAALAGAQRNAYVHRDQVGGTRRRQADGRWVDREPAPAREKQPALSKMTIGQFIAHYAVYVLSVAAVVVIVVLLIFGVRLFGDFAGPAPVEEGYVSPYDWSKLDRADERYAYVVDGQVKSRLGIDVSEHEYDIDWEAVANDGVEFAIVRLGYRGATEGTLNLDEYYAQNLAGAKAAGLDCGVFFFSQAITPEEAREEAAFVLDHLNGEPLEYPIAFDWERVTGIGETRTSGLVSTELPAIADAFCDTIEAAGYRTLVYGNPIEIARYDETVLTGRHVWWAEYGVAEPSHDVDIVMWQYASDGAVAGINAAVDMNIDLSGAL